MQIIRVIYHQGHISSIKKTCFSGCGCALPADLADRLGGLDAELEWSHVLSLGEQQRIAFLRLLMHEPALAFLDEATGALDTATEAGCYRALQKHSTSFVSVGKTSKQTFESGS